MKCMVHHCDRRGVVASEVVLMGKRMRVRVCELHYELVRDVKEEKALRREQAAERRRWSDPLKAVLELS